MRLFQLVSLFFLVSLFSIGCGFEHQPSLQNKVQKSLGQSPDSSGELPKSYENPTPEEKKCRTKCNEAHKAAEKQCAKVKCYYLSKCVKEAKAAWHACIDQCFYPKK